MLSTLGSSIRQLSNESASSTPDNDEEFGEIGCAVGKRVASIVHDSRVSRSGIDRETAGDVEGEEGEIRLSWK